MTDRKTKPDGYWVRYAWLVRTTAEQHPGVPIRRIVKQVLQQEGIPVEHRNIENLRVTYYAVKRKAVPDPDPAPEGEDESFLDPELRAELEQEEQEQQWI